MKHLKTYEENTNTPKIGNYVIVNGDHTFDDPDFSKIYTELNMYLNFIKTNIGYIFKKPNENYSLIKYNNIPEIIKKYFQYSDYSDGLKKGNSVLIHNSNIEHCSNNKEELKKYIIANNYNL